MSELSDALIKSRYASVVDPEVVLCTVTAVGLNDPIVFCDQPGGFTSNGVFYPFYPFTITFGGASMDEPSKAARLEVANVDGSLIEAIRSVSQKPVINVQVVRVAAPNTPEQELVGVVLDDADVSIQTISFTMSPRSFKTEPACKARYIMARTPSLF